jgi:ribose transport system substrate-binding protein
MWIPLVLVVAAVLGVTAIIGLRSGYETPQPLRVMVVLKATSPQMEFWQVVRQGIEAAARNEQVVTEVVGPWFEHEIDEQIDIMNRAITQRPDGIILAASDFERLREPVAAATAAGIPVVTVDSDVDHDAIQSFVGTNNVVAGARAGEEMTRRVAPDARVAIVSHIPGVATAIEREEGAWSVLAARPHGETLGPYYALNDEVRAREIVEELVGGERPIDGIVALNETSTVGVALALEALGFGGRVVVVGFDASAEEVSLLERGMIHALVVQKPFNMGYQSLEALAAVIRGTTIPARIDTGSEVVHIDNMYTESIQRLIFPLIR